MEYFDKLGKAGVGFISIMEQMDFSSPWGKFALGMLGGLAELYSDNLSQETKKGWDERREQGLYCGTLSFGAMKGEDGVPVPDTRERIVNIDGKQVILKNYDGLKTIFELEKLGIVKAIFKVKRLSTLKKERLNKAEEFLKTYKINEEQALVFISILVDGKTTSEIKAILKFFSVKGKIVNDIIKFNYTLKKFHINFSKLEEEDLFFTLESIKEFYILAYLTKATGKEESFINKFMSKMRFIKLEIRGMDLKNLGLKEGPQYREIFKEILRLKIKGKISSKDDELNYVIKNKEKYILD
jgi:hypothetical protein